MRIAFVNACSDAELLPSALAVIVTALQEQLVTDWAPQWGRIPPELYIAASADDVAPTTALILFVDQDADVPGALGYHSVNATGVAYGRVLVKTLRDYGATLSSGANSISVTASHEVLELATDPFADWWCDVDDGLTEEPLETCDRVEGDAYEVLGVSVSNFLLPAAFRMGVGEGPYDKLGKLTTRGGMTPGGYQTLRNGGPTGSVAQVFGDAIPDWKKEMKRLLGSRTARRSV